MRWDFKQCILIKQQYFARKIKKNETVGVSLKISYQDNCTVCFV